MSEPILAMKSVRKTFRGIVALETVDLDVRRGERLAIIGPNGSGKTTLMNCVAGRYLPDGGIIWFKGEVITRLPAHARARRGIARTFQLPQPFQGLTIAENVMVPLEFVGKGAGLHSMREMAIEALRPFGLVDKADHYAETLTQVDLRKLELARATAVQPEVLIADEALAGLSDAEVDEMLQTLVALNERGITIIFIEHIMRAVKAFAQRIVCLEAGTKIAEGEPEEVLRNPRVERAYLGE